MNNTIASKAHPINLNNLGMRTKTQRGQSKCLHPTLSLPYWVIVLCLYPEDPHSLCSEEAWPPLLWLLTQLVCCSRRPTDALGHWETPHFHHGAMPIFALLKVREENRAIRDSGGKRSVFSFPCSHPLYYRINLWPQNELRSISV